MRKFIKQIFKFSFLPLVIGFIFLVYAEITLYNYPSTFQLKAKYAQNNIDKINVLALGSSHNQNALNPELIKNLNTINLAFGGQTIKIDSALLSKYIESPNLQIVIFELSYHTLEHAYDPKYHRNSLYLRFYNINLFNRKLNPLDFSIYFSKPKLYKKYLIPWSVPPLINKYGFVTQLSAYDDERNRFKNLNYDEKTIMLDSSNIFISRHKNEDLIAFEANTFIMSGMIESCEKKNIIPIIMMPPVYKNYFKNFLVEKEQRRQDYLKMLKQKHISLIVLNYEQDKKFIVTDFKNEDHLNPKGAKKVSLKIDSIINVLKNHKTAKLEILQ